MAIIPYRERGVSTEAGASLSEINQYSLSTKALLTALGDYWTNYYRNLEPIATAATGAVASLSKEYTRLLDLVRSANILDIPLRQSEQFRLLVIRAADVQPVLAESGEIAYFFVPIPEIADASYLTGSLFESRIVLEKGVHFEIEQGAGIRFYVDIFGDKAITGYTYEIGEERDQGILLWACDIAFQSSVIYERYGRFLYRKAIDGEQYKWLVSALMRFYENAKSVESIQNVLNIMYGVPYTRYKDEIVKDVYYVDKELNRTLSQIEEPYICVETDRSLYYTYAFSDILYKPGDIVPQFSLLANFNIVEDYITKPGWWEDCAFPDKLVSGPVSLTKERQNDLMDKVLKYNLVHIKLGVSFETYATYLAQVKQFFNIIESGFPVYLYPLIDTFFRAVFLDKWDISEELLKLRLALGLESLYPWGNKLKFNGEAEYYMEPDRDHGKDFTCDPRLFDGQNLYAPPARHHCEEKNILHFGGGGYSASWKRDHGNDIEFLRIEHVGTRFGENYPWETSPNLKILGLSYSGAAKADGANMFGDSFSFRDSDPLRLAAEQKMEDCLPPPKESESDFAVKYKPLRDCQSGATFNGGFSYNGATGFGQKALTDSFKAATRQRFADNYPWESSPNIVLTPIAYAGAITADGAHIFGEAISEKKPEKLLAAIGREFADKAIFSDECAKINFSARFSSGFPGYAFDGAHKYSGASVCGQSYSEDFSFVCMRR